MVNNKRKSLRKIRVLKGIPVSKVAKVLGISRQSVYNKENGVCDWTAREINKLCDFYDVSIEEIKF